MANLTRLLWRSPSVIITLVAVLVAMGFFTRLSYQQFLFLQAQNLSSLSVFNEVIMPLAGLTLISQLLVGIIASVQLMPRLVQLGQSFLIYQAGIPPLQSYLILVFPIIIISFIPWLFFLLISIHIDFASQLDTLRLLVAAIGLISVGLVGVMVVVCCNFVASRVLTGLLLSTILVATLLSFDSMNALLWSQSYWRGLLSPFYRFREGIVVVADLIALSGWLVFLFSLGFLLLHRRLTCNKNKPLSILFIGVFLVATAGLYQGQWDLTNDKRNSLDSILLTKLEQQDQPLVITAVINEETNRDEILRGFDVVKRFYDKSEISFRARQSLGPEFQYQGEYIQFQLGEMYQAIAYPLEYNVKASFEMAISQMLRRKSQWITFVEGHGEASPIAKNTSDLGELHNTIKMMGWPVAAQNLTTTPVISDNTGLLVIASSKQSWQKQEEDLVLDYLKNGGNLLLMVDPDSVMPPRLEETIGISRIPGTLVDWSGYQGGTPHPAIVIVNQLTDHPTVNKLNNLLAFPWASALEVVELKVNPNVEYTSILRTPQGVWTEFNVESEQLAFNQEQGELQGSFDIALARVDQSNQQKVVVVGDSHFASDSAVNNYANKQFALNLISWLTNLPIDEQQVAQNRDSSLRPSRLGHFVFNWGYGLLLPSLLLLLWFWRKRRRFNA
ncbi:Gldg family protein [Aliikangiella marina]|nr:Gldg family protein [Aliikangiella marina]